MLTASAAILSLAAALGWLAGRQAAAPVPGLSYRRLTYGNGPIQTARFGPDGKTVFCGAAWEGGPFRVYQTRPEGGELALPLGSADLLSVSRDGQLAILLPKRYGGNAWYRAGTLAVVPTLGAAPAPVRVAEGFASSLSPDARFVAVPESDGLRLVPTGPSAARALPLGFAPASDAVWGPTGDDIVVAEAGDGGRVRLKRVALSDGRVRSISAPFLPDSLLWDWPSPVSPDGRLVAVRGLVGGILLVPLDGGTPRGLAASEANDAPVLWTGDSQSLFVFRPGEIPARVFRLDVDGGRRALWKEIRLPDTSATGVGVLHLSRDGRVGVYGATANATNLYLVDGLR